MQMSERAKARIIENLIRKSREGKREQFMREGCAIMQYAQRHDGPDNPDYDKDEYFGAKITKTGEARQIFGNAIYQQNPDLSYMMKAVDPAARAEAETAVAYLKQSMKEVGAERYRKRAVDQAVVWGRGVVHTLLDTDGRVVSRWFPVKDFYLDLDAISHDEVRWMARRRYSQKADLQKKFPEKRDLIAGLSSVSKHDEKDANIKGDERRFRHDPCDLVEWYVVYLRVGLHRFYGGTDKSNYQDQGDENKPETAELDDGAKRYVVASNGDSCVLLHEGPWDIPFWRDGHWPFETLDLIDDDDGNWPVSTLSAGLPWQRAIDALTQRALAKTDFNLRDIIVILRDQGVDFSEEDVDRILNGEDVEVITPQATANDADINRALKHFQFNQISPEFERIIALCENYFEKATGLNELMYSGQGVAQFRNAAAANLAASASTARVDEYRQRVEAWVGRLAAKESFAARVLLNNEDIARVVGQQQAQAWRTLVPPLDVHRQMLVEQFPELVERPDMLEQFLLMDRQGSVTLDEWLYEWRVEIVPGSTMRPSIQKKELMAEYLMNQPFSAALNAGQIGLALKMLDIALDAHGVDPEIRQQVAQLALQQSMPQPDPMQTMNQSQGAEAAAVGLPF